MGNWNPLEIFRRIFSTIFVAGAIPRIFGAFTRPQASNNPPDANRGGNPAAPAAPTIVQDVPDFSDATDSLSDSVGDLSEAVSGIGPEFAEVVDGVSDAVNTAAGTLFDMAAGVSRLIPPPGNGNDGASDGPEIVHLAPSDDDMLRSMGINPDDQLEFPIPDFEVPEIETPEWMDIDPFPADDDDPVETSNAGQPPDRPVPPDSPSPPNFNEIQQRWLDAITKGGEAAAANQPEAEFELIRPPENLFEHVIESFSRFAARLMNLQVPDGHTATQTVLDRVFGRVRNVPSNPRTISQAASPFGQQGAMNRQANSAGMLGGFGRFMATSRVGTAAAATTAAPSLAMIAAVALPVIALIALVAAVGVTTRAMQRLARMGIAAADRVSKFSGTILAARAALEVGRTVRDIEKANAIGSDAANYYRSVNRFEQAMEPIYTGLEKMGLKIAAFTIGFGADFVESPYKTLMDIAMPDFIFGRPEDGFVQDILIKAAAEIDKKLANVLVFLGLMAKEHEAPEGPVNMDPLALHNIMINGAFRGQRPKVPGLGAAPGKGP
jgi:hypothetical protein